MAILVILAIILGGIIFLLGLSSCIFGFRPIGVAANSCAACCQSCIGNVAKGSCFAIMTCLGMRGCFIAFIIIGLLILAGVGIYCLVTSEWFQSIFASNQLIFSISSMNSHKGFLKNQYHFLGNSMSGYCFLISNILFF